MSSFVSRETVRIPSIPDLEAFRSWTRSPDFPEQGRYCYLNGAVWVDVSMERAVHNQIKGEIPTGLTLLVKQTRSGTLFVDRMWLTNDDDSFATEPDAMYVSYESLKSGKARLDEGMESLELIGSPDMTLEVISPSSEEKDTVVQRDLFWRAGVREYWLVDSRAEEPALEILRHTARGYVTTRQQAGWVKSVVFGKSFRLRQSVNPIGNAEFTLEVR